MERSLEKIGISLSKGKGRTCNAAWETLQKKGEGEHEIKKSRSTLAIDIKKIKEETKLDISAYNFRHDFATDQRKNGETREEIAEKMGHRSKVSPDCVWAQDSKVIVHNYREEVLHVFAFFYAFFWVVFVYFRGSIFVRFVTR
jgi:hypothetical protein